MLLDGAHSTHDIAESVANEIKSGRCADDWTVRLNDGADAGRLTSDILRLVRDQALLVA
jgi:hypothetical protein